MKVGREYFRKTMDDYYQKRGWSLDDASPLPEKIKELELDFTLV
jgi:aldehyde:ferredoxin oxidoreductase